MAIRKTRDIPQSYKKINKYRIVKVNYGNTNVDKIK